MNEDTIFTRFATDIEIYNGGKADEKIGERRGEDREEEEGGW